MLSTFPLRGYQVCAAFVSLAAHAAVAVAAAHYGTGRPAIAVPPAEIDMQVEAVVIPAHHEIAPVAPDHDPVQRPPHAEHRSAGAEHTLAAAPHVVVAEPSPRPTFAIVLGAAETSGGLSSTVGTGDGSGMGLVRGSGSEAERTAGEGDDAIPDSAISQHARMVSFETPVYPPAALAQGIEVSVSFEIIVDRQGNVTSARVVHGAGYGFDEAALRSLRSARLSPAMRDGHPVRVRMPWVVDFHIE